MTRQTEPLVRRLQVTILVFSMSPRWEDTVARGHLSEGSGPAGRRRQHHSEDVPSFLTRILVLLES